MTQIWTAFGKFVANQIKQGRTVDTQICGLLSSNGDGKVQYKASPDFLSACKLKMKDQPAESYDQDYAMAAKDCTMVNFGSIAMVCG